MSEFVIQCAVCSVSFSNEAQYDEHQCQGGQQMDGLQVKMEPTEELQEEEMEYDHLEPQEVEEEEVEEEEELDVKPVLSSTGEVIPQKPAQPTARKVKATKIEHANKRSKFDKPVNKKTTEKIIDHMLSMMSTKSKKTRQKKKYATSLYLKASAGIVTKNLHKKAAAAPATAIDDTEDVDSPQAMEVNIKPEPIELCEIVDVKEEPSEYDDDDEETAGEESRDPLGNTAVQDILGLHDEDYLIENFVEYDQEWSNNLEIDESASDNQSVTGSITEDESNPIAVQQDEQHSPAAAATESNVGKRIMSTENRGHGCTICNKKFFEKSMLDEHLLLAHRTPRPYSCSVCHKKFTHKNYVNLHMRVHTGEKPYKCTLCSRSYSHKTSFTIHMRIHKGDRPYECSVCGKKCYDKSGLTSHMRSHTKETPYQCECCGRKFTHSKSLLVHRRNHTGEKPYVCPHCGRAFRHWHKHKIHIRLHTGERPYKCQICNKGFPRNDEVKRHMKSHTGIKSFKCSICGVYCATQASITGHINLHHVNLTTNRKFLPDKTIVENSQSGILGKGAQVQRSMHRQVDNTSYDDFQPTSKTKAKVAVSSASQTTASKFKGEKSITASSGGGGESSTMIPQTIVSTRPMTPQEKVNNKSMTYRQFLNDQEQQLLAKGLKVVNKNNNTYGLAKVTPNGNIAIDTPSALIKQEGNESSGDQKMVKSESSKIDNMFVRVPQIRKNHKTDTSTTSTSNTNTSTTPAVKQPTRIILPNYVGNKSALVLGEAATKLLLQSVDQGSSTTTTTTTNSAGATGKQSNKSPSTTQQIFIQTVGSNMSISTPLILQATPQQQGKTSSGAVSSQAGYASSSLVFQTSNVNSNKTTTTSSSTTSSSSILQAALTSNKKAGGGSINTTAGTGVAKINPSVVGADTGNIIVLNKGVAGESSSSSSSSGNSGATNTTNSPLVMFPQPIVQQQLLLLPGINGGPARLVLLQPNSTIMANTNSSSSSNTSTIPNLVMNKPGTAAAGVLQVKQEPGVQLQQPMVQLHDTSAVTSNSSSNSSSGSSSSSTSTRSINGTIMFMNPTSLANNNKKNTSPSTSSSSIVTNSCSSDTAAATTTIKSEPIDDSDRDSLSPPPAVQIKQEEEDEASTAELASPLLIPNIIKLEPID